MPIIGKLKPIPHEFQIRPIVAFYSFRKPKGKSSLETRGELNGNAKLTEEDIRFIRTSGLTNRELRERFNTTQSHITNIQKFRAWRHVK